MRCEECLRVWGAVKHPVEKSSCGAICRWEKWYVREKERRRVQGKKGRACQDFAFSCLPGKSKTMCFEKD